MIYQKTKEKSKETDRDVTWINNLNRNHLQLFGKTVWGIIKIENITKDWEEIELTK